jgi:hypothetical protein
MLIIHCVSNYIVDATSLMVKNRNDIFIQNLSIKWTEATLT